MTVQYRNRIDALLAEYLTHIDLSDVEKRDVQGQLSTVIQKEFFYRLVINLPEKEVVDVRKKIQKGDDQEAHVHIARICMQHYSKDEMRSRLEETMTHVVTTHINVTMGALTNEQRTVVEDFQKNLLLAQTD